jgi:ABC-2 type transport system ATP-binding protein
LAGGGVACVAAEGLGKRYGSVWGLVEAGFSAPWGAVTVIAGPNGAGKTTTVGILATILRPSRGRATVAGYDVVREAWRVRERIALVPQDARVDPNWTPREAVKWYLVARGWRPREAEARAREVLEALGLLEVADRPGWGLSGGQRRLTVNAMVLASEAPVVFLDEPTTGVDVEKRYQVWSLIRSYAREGRCIIMTTHDMQEAGRLADHVVLLSRGRVVAEGSPEELRSRLPYRYRVVARRPRREAPPGGLGAPVLRIGDTLILYAETRSEALALASELEAESVSVEETGFEDVYLYHVHRGGPEGR